MLQNRTERFVKQMAIAVLALGFSVGAAQAGEFGTKDEAKALVDKAVAFYKANGAEKAYAAFTAPSKDFVDRDLYVVAYDLDGNCLAHGSNAKLVGKPLIDVQDADGKAYVKERVDLAKSQGKFWQDYKFANPVTKKIAPKETYCDYETGGPIICVGFYKQ